jgi:starch synthase (maltosyl-transferring)
MRAVPWLLVIALAVLATGCATLPPVASRDATTALADTTGTRLGRVVAADVAAHPGLTGVHAVSLPRDAFAARVLLAGTLAASYGIYGPAFELIERAPREPGSEEYLDSEKYQLRQWDLEHEDSLRWLIKRLNEIRRENPALQSDWSLAFLPIDNEQLIAYSKSTADRSNIIVTVVNIDPHHAHSGWLQLDAATLGLALQTPYQMHDLLTDVRYLWHGPLNFVQLEPGMAHIFRVRRRVHTEHDFDYFG